MFLESRPIVHALLSLLYQSLTEDLQCSSGQILKTHCASRFFGEKDAIMYKSC